MAAFCLCAQDLSTAHQHPDHGDRHQPIPKTKPTDATGSITVATRSTILPVVRSTTTLTRHGYAADAKDLLQVISVGSTTHRATGLPVVGSRTQAMDRRGFSGMSWLKRLAFWGLSVGSTVGHPIISVLPGNCSTATG
jgi:hypothetical protein